MKLKIVCARAMVVPIIAVAISGCGYAPNPIVGSGSQLYDPGSSVVSGGRGPSASTTYYDNSLPSRKRRSQSALESPATQYRLWNLNLDAAYQRLSTHMDHAGQLALSSEQTGWLNDRANTCMLTGALDFRCAIRLTSERVAELRARPLPASLIVAEETPLPKMLPSVARTMASHVRSQATASTILVPRALPVQPTMEIAPPPVSKAPATGHIYAVAVTAMPWIWHNGGVNQRFKFGYPNGTPPTLVPLATAGAAPGDLITIKYTGGSIAIGTGGPAADGNGFAGLYSDGSRSLLGAFPSSYMHPYPINLGALVGAFTDINGAIIGQPFAIDDGTVQLPMPAGAARLQLGINDDNFGGITKDAQNSGGFTVSVAVAKADAPQ